MSKVNGRKLQILSAHEDSQQLDLLSFISEHALPEIASRTKEVREKAPRSHVSKVASYHFHGSLDKNKTFGTFCLGKPNQFTVDSLKRFITSDKSDYGVVFLKAASGLGKSHILHAVANELTALKKSFYFSSPLLMSPVLDTFNMLKIYDFVLVDDAEEIEGCSEFQKIFCQLVDLAQSGKIKLVVTSSKLPKDLINCEDRLKGKLSAALIHHIDEMNSDLAFSIVEKKAMALNLDLPESVKRLISNQHDFNVYGFESLLLKLKTAFEIKGQKITLESVLEEIKDKKVQYRPDEFNSLIDSVAESFHVSTMELKSSVRKKEFALARHAAMYLLNESKNVNVMKIAEIFERDHSSVIHGIARIRDQLTRDLSLRAKIDTLLM